MAKKIEWGNIPMKGEEYASLTIKQIAQKEAGLESYKSGQLAKVRKGNGIKAKESGQLLKAAIKGGESMRDSGKLDIIRALPKKLPYTTTEIYSINKETKNKIKYKSQHDASRILNLPIGNINKVLTGERKSVGGYYFEYKK
jgi:hypothetical protein